jgi:hypothetical protein
MQIYLVKTMLPLMLYIFSFLGFSQTSIAQKYKVGDRVEVDVEGNGNWVKATIKQVNFGPYVNGDYLVRLDAPDAIGGIEYTFLSNKFNLIRLQGSNTNSITTDCKFGPPAGTFTDASPASTGLFKRLVYDKVNMLATGVGGNPRRIGLTFKVVQNTKTYKNTVTVYPGRGAMRLNDAAPVNAIIYSTTLKYIVCEDYSPGISRKMVESKYDFFIDRYGKWNASQTGSSTVTILE